MRTILSAKHGGIYLLFFLSGISALIYEIAWLNRIQLIMGNTIYALSTVLGAYLSGLAVGALAAHRIASRNKQCLNLYLIFELTIGLYGLLFTFVLALISRLYAPLVTDTNVPLPVLSLIQFFFCGLVIFIPTFLMGATLPLLAKHLYPDPDELAEKIGELYGVNTLGALVGCVLAGYFLLPGMGYGRTMQVAAGINAFLFVLALLRFPGERFSYHDLFPEGGAAKGKNEKWFSLLHRGLASPLVWLMFLSGCLSLFAQLLWNRLAALSFGPSIYVFPLVTATILAGIFLGSLLAGRYAGSAESSSRFLGVNLLAAVPVLILSNHFVGQFPMAILWLNSTVQLGHGTYVLFQFLLMALVALPASTMLGAIFPAALSLYARKEASDSSLSVGVAYGMNIAGVLAGAILGGFLLIPVFGLDTLTRAITAGLLVSLLILLESQRSRWIHYASVAFLGLIALKAPPPFERTVLTSGYFYNRIHSTDVKDFHTYYDSLKSFHDTYRYGLIDYKDDAHGTISIHEHVSEPGERWFRIDGKTDGNRHGDVATVRLLDYFPQLFGDKFENVLTIGLGTGESANLTHDIPGMKHSKVIELSPSIIEFSRKHFPENSFYVWNDPRIQVINRDGREYLLHTREKFDLIMSEPSNPWVNGVSSLFTREFFTSIAEHLKPGGLASVWFHSYGLSCDAFDSVVMAAYHSFKYLILFRRSGDFYFIASNDRPLEIRPLPAERKHLEPLILSMIDGSTRTGNVTDEYTLKLNGSVWIRNRERLDRFAPHSGYNSDDNQFLQYSSGRTFRRGISCYLNY
ncbi:MAG TPA: fused MFS/spermidine synthase [Bdellovibrionota bacterium]|jgi:spermidine synthase